VEVFEVFEVFRGGGGYVWPHKEVKELGVSWDITSLMAFRNWPTNRFIGQARHWRVNRNRATTAFPSGASTSCLSFIRAAGAFGCETSALAEACPSFIGAKGVVSTSVACPLLIRATSAFISGVSA
jgi:hypothetical protein